MTNKLITAITGATGFIGSRVARALADSGREQVLIVRDKTKAPELPGAEVRQAAYGDTPEARKALEGVDVLFMVSGGENPRREQDQIDFVRAAADTGVKHILYLSFLHPAPDATYTYARVHYSTEQAIKSSGMKYTFLRPNLYADLVSVWTEDDDILTGAAGDGKVSLVARRDVASVAGRIMLNPAKWEGETINITGPRAISFDKIAAILTDVTGEPFRYVEQTVDESYEMWKKKTSDPLELEAAVTTFTAIAKGELAEVHTDFENIIGRPASAPQRGFVK